MKFYRIKAMLIRNLYLYQRSFPRLLDILYWPVLELLLWGFISAYLEKSSLGGVNILTLLMGAIIFWDLMSQSQRAVSVSFLEELWEKNFLNIFVSPLKLNEFLAASVLLGLVRVVLVSVVMGLLAFLFYSFNIFIFGFTLIPLLINLLLFGWILGLFTMGIVLRYGSSAQVLAFGFIALIQPFSAVFYPVSALPQKLQYVSYALPSTYVFEGMRAVVSTGIFPWKLFGFGLGLNILFLVLVIFYFHKMFAWVKKKGLLAKLDF